MAGKMHYYDSEDRLHKNRQIGIESFFLGTF